MRIRVTQPKTPQAVHALHVILNDIHIGEIGPGESVTGHTFRGENVPWNVVVVSGHERAEASGLDDVTLQVVWKSGPARMELLPVPDTKSN